MHKGSDWTPSVDPGRLFLSQTIHNWELGARGHFVMSFMKNDSH